MCEKVSDSHDALSPPAAVLAWERIASRSTGVQQILLTVQRDDKSLAREGGLQGLGGGSRHPVVLHDDTLDLQEPVKRSRQEKLILSTFDVNLKQVDSLDSIEEMVKGNARHDDLPLKRRVVPL